MPTCLFLSAMSSTAFFCPDGDLYRGSIRSGKRDASPGRASGGGRSQCGVTRAESTHFRSRIADFGLAARGLLGTGLRDLCRSGEVSCRAGGQAPTVCVSFKAGLRDLCRRGGYPTQAGLMVSQGRVRRRTRLHMCCRAVLFGSQAQNTLTIRGGSARMSVKSVLTGGD
jgi:hypothetical protein